MDHVCINCGDHAPNAWLGPTCEGLKQKAKRVCAALGRYAGEKIAPVYAALTSAARISTEQSQEDAWAPRARRCEIRVWLSFELSVEKVTSKLEERHGLEA